VSQQINLLVAPHRAPALSAVRSASGLGIVLIALVGYSVYGWIGSRQLGHTVSQSDTQLAAERATLKDLEEKLGARPKTADLVAQINALKAQAGESEQIINLLQTGGGASRDGYAGHLTALARIAEEDVWLTNVSIVNAGRTVHVEGRSLRSDSVMRYARRLNDQFSVYGAQFTALELLPATETAPGAAISFVTFKLF
jgi:cell division protein FtsB